MRLIHDLIFSRPRLFLSRPLSSLLWVALLNISPLYALESNLQPGGFYIGKVSPGSQVIYSGKAIRTGKQGQFIIGFGRDAELDQSVILIDPEGKREEVKLVLMPREYKVQKITGVEKSM